MTKLRVHQYQMWPKSVLRFLFAVGMLAASVSFADPATPSLGVIAEEATPRRVRVYVAPAYALFSRDGNTLSGVDIQLGVVYAFGEQWAVEGGAQQAFSTSGFSALYSSLELGISYAVTGSQLRNVRVVRVNQAPLAQRVEMTRAAFLVGAAAKQYFFNGSQNVLPFTGLSVSGQYRFPSQNDVNIAVGSSVDFIANGSQAAVGVKFFSRFALWM